MNWAKIPILVLQMLLRVTSSARRRSNRQHKATLRLFEIAMQARSIVWAMLHIRPDRWAGRLQFRQLFKDMALSLNNAVRY